MPEHRFVTKGIRGGSPKNYARNTRTAERASS
jgi:hypothetical protein